jgi:branched-subunit amino acid permease
MATSVAPSTQNRGPTIVAAICAVTAISTVFAIARLYVRARVMKKVHYDDYLIVFSVVSLYFDNTEFLKR